MASNITTRVLFEQRFPDTELSESVFDASHHTALRFDKQLSFDAAMYLLAGDMGRQLHLCQSIVLHSHEQSRYFLIYEILKALIKFSHGTIMLQVRPVVDTSTADTGQGSELAQAIGYEQTIKGTKVSAKIEFVLTNKRDDKILVAIEVKPTLYPEAYMWQALAEAVIIAQHNEGTGYVCLTDGGEWKLFKAQKQNDKYLVTASKSLTMFDSALTTKASDTLSALSMLCSVMFRDQLLPSAEEIASAYAAVDSKLQKETDLAASSVAEVMKLREESARLRKRVSELENNTSHKKTHL